MNPGELRHRLTIQRPTEIKNDYGEVEYDWDHPIDVVTVWAAKESETSRAFFAAQRTYVEMTALFKIRYITGITHGMRVIYDNAPYEIYVPPIDSKGRKRELQLITKAVI